MYEKEIIQRMYSASGVLSPSFLDILFTLCLNRSSAHVVKRCYGSFAL